MINNDNFFHSEYSTVLSDLKFISKIKPKQKINVEKRTVVNDDWISVLNRTFINVETRTQTYQFVQTTVIKAIHLLDFNDKNQVDPTFSFDIKKDLIGVIDGIENLKTTYVSDTNITSKFDVIIESIKRKLLPITFSD